MPELQLILLYALPFVLVASLLEAAVLSYRARQLRARNPAVEVEDYDWRAMGISLLDQVGRGLMRLVPFSLAGPAFLLAEQHRLMTLELNSLLAVAILFFGQEFLYYWYHRAAHRVRFFWCNHAVHHSPNQLNLSAAYRLGWFGQFAGAAIFFTPLVWLGFDKTVVLTVVGINLLYQFWIHATWIPRLGWLEYVFNTPSAHRVHHASNLDYLDANYGGVLIIFDRLFGTYVAERDDERCVYGWVRPVSGYNPLRIEIQPWLNLARDMATAGSIRGAMAYLINPPGWRADGPGETTEDLRSRAGTRPPVVSPAQVLLQPHPGTLS